MARGARVATGYEIRLHRDALKAYRRLQGPLKDRVRDAIDTLAENPRPAGTVKLAGRDDYRIRVGNHRVVYAINDSDRLVVIARIAHRSDVYRH